MKSPTGYSSTAKAKQDLRPNTLWKVMSDMRRLHPTQARQVAVELCERYREATIREFGFWVDKRRHRGLPLPVTSSPDELAHEFLFVHILEKQLFQRADKTKGRFRDLLWQCLANFWKDKLKAVRPAIPVEEVDALLIGMPADKPGRNFDRAFAEGLAREVLDGLAEQWRKDGKEELFTALRPYILIRPYGIQKKLAFGLKTNESTVSLQLKELKSSFLRRFKAEVRSIVWDPDDDDQVKAENNYLLSLLGEGWGEIFGMPPPD